MKIIGKQGLRRRFFRGPKAAGPVLALISVLGVVSFFASTSRAADQDQFLVQELSIDGWMLGSLVGDFDGDKLRDVAIIYYPISGDGDKRYIGLFAQDQATGYSVRPTHIAPLPATASQFQAVDVEGDGIDEIVFIDDRGVQALSWSPVSGFGSSVRLARRPTVFQAGAFRGALLNKFALEINGSPGIELIIPTPGGVAIFEPGEDGSYELLNEISLKSLGSHSEQRMFFRRSSARSYVIESAEISALDANLDGRTDLFFLWSDRVYLFLQDESGNFPRSADQEIIFSSFASNETCFSIIADCNGDGRPDVVALRLQGGISAAECKVDFYLSDQAGRFAKSPDKTLTLSQARASLLLTDIDGDGVPELALPTVELGAVSTIKMMMQKRGGLYLLIYNLQNGVPADDAAKRKKFNFALDYKAEAPDQEVLFDWSADFNSDGIKDLIFSNGGGSLEIYYGSRSGFLEDDPSVEIPLADVGAIGTHQLNRDGRSDVLVERVNSGRVNGVWALLSK